MTVHKTINLEENFTNLHFALGAESYRITIKYIKTDGETSAAFLLDGKKDGFSFDEFSKNHFLYIKQYVQEEKNIYVTPLSKTVCYILVDDLTKEIYINRFFSAGYRPAILIRSSPNNYQAVLKTPLSDINMSEQLLHDVANKVFKEINFEFGDKAIRAVVHPFRVPGTLNFKPKYRRENGTYPDVALLNFEDRFCDKIGELFRKTIIDLQMQEQQYAQEQEKQRNYYNNSVVSNNIISQRAYSAHYDNLRKRHSMENLSDVDAKIAVSLRLIGLTQQQIQDTIEEMAPTIRSMEESRKHNWADYAKRTAEFAFSFKGTMHMRSIEKYKNFFIKIAME
jgi:hypothetical protein